jgi:hypothetical protein
MEFIKRIVPLYKYLQPYSSNNDGILDSLAIQPIDKSLQIPIVHRLDDIGVYTVLTDEEQDEFEIIELDSVWDFTNDGTDQIPNWSPGVSPTTDFEDETLNSGAAEFGDFGVIGCIDDTATNYVFNINPALYNLLDPNGANYDPSYTYQGCSDCCEYPAEGFENEQDNVDYSDPNYQTCTPEGTFKTNVWSHSCNPPTTNVEVYEYGGSGVLPEDSNGNEYPDASRLLKMCSTTCTWTTDDWDPTWKNTTRGRADTDCQSTLSNCPGVYYEGTLPDDPYYDNPGTGEVGDCSTGGAPYNWPFPGTMLKETESVTCCKEKKTGWFCKKDTNPTAPNSGTITKYYTYNNGSAPGGNSDGKCGYEYTYSVTNTSVDPAVTTTYSNVFVEVSSWKKTYNYCDETEERFRYKYCYHCA